MANIINPSLLVAADILQEAIVSKIGQPLVNGIVSCYENNSRTIYKNWYYQSSANAGSSSPTFNALPNPLTLSAAGTICDVNGNDVIPYFYPYDELDNATPQRYYITIYDQYGKLQFTRSYFPYNITSVNATGNTVVEQNLIINNRYWRNNYTSNALTATGTTPAWNTGVWTYQYDLSAVLPYYYATLAPSQHDGFSMPDFCYLTQNTGATDILQFKSFPQSDGPILTDDITPQYYLNYQCTGTGSNTVDKLLQFPLSYQLLSIAPGTTLTFTIQSLNNGSTSATFSVYLYRFLGSDVSSTPANDPKVLIGNFTTTTAWTKYVSVPIEFPITDGLTISSLASDSAYYIQIYPPLGETFNVSLALPSVYLSNTVPTNEFATYDQIDSIINTPRTGDIRTSINNFVPFGWVAMNDGTIGYSATSSTYITARNNTDTWPLYSLLWNMFYKYSTAPGNTGSNPVLPMYNTSGGSIGYGVGSNPSTAWSDFDTGNALALTKSMGRVLMGTVPLQYLLPYNGVNIGYTATFTAISNVLTITFDAPFNLFVGLPVTFENTTTLLANTVYYVTNLVNNHTFSVASSFANALSGTAITVASDSGTVNYAPAGSTEGEYAHTQLVGELARHSHTPLAPASFFYTTSGTGPNVTTIGTGSALQTTTGTTGNSTAFNVTQPGTFMNVFIKL